MKRIVILLWINLPLMVWAQLPKTDLYAFDMKQYSDTTIVVDLGRFLNGFNEGGYNNQPFFINEDEVMVTVGRQGQTQPDIYHLNLRTKEYYPITQTSSGEYSPQLSWDRTQIQCVRLQNELDSDSAAVQNLWTFPEELDHGGRSLIPQITNVGYFVGQNDSMVYAFLTGEPHQLASINLRTEEKYVFTSNIGRCLKMYNGYLYFIHKISETNWYLKKFDPVVKRSSVVINMPEGVEDFEILPSGTFICGQKGQLLLYNDRPGNVWKKFTDLGDYGIDNISRLAYHVGTLILVNRNE